MKIVKSLPSEYNLVAGLFDQYRVFYKQPSNIELSIAFIKERLQNNQSVVFVALTKIDNKETPVGFTQLYLSFSSIQVIKIWILNDLYVVPEYRKKGVGTLLIREAIDMSKKDKASIVKLETAKNNYTAKSLYEKIGFKQDLSDSVFDTYTYSL